MLVNSGHPNPAPAAALGRLKEPQLTTPTEQTAGTSAELDPRSAATTVLSSARNERLRNSVASYARAFPDANLGAIEAHLTLVSTGGAVTSGLRAHIAGIGFDLTPSRFTLLRLLYLTPERRLPQNEIAQQMAKTSSINPRSS